MQLKAITSHYIASYLENVTDLHLTTDSFQVVAQSHEGFSETPLPQTKQSQLPQPFS